MTRRKIPGHVSHAAVPRTNHRKRPSPQGLRLASHQQAAEDRSKKAHPGRRTVVTKTAPSHPPNDECRGPGRPSRQPESRRNPCDQTAWRRPSVIRRIRREGETASLIESAPHTGTTVSHLRWSAESSTASQTAWVARASRKVGAVDWPLARLSRKSATWWTKVCS